MYDILSNPMFTTSYLFMGTVEHSLLKGSIRSIPGSNLYMLDTWLAVGAGVLSGNSSDFKDNMTNFYCRLNTPQSIVLSEEDSSVSSAIMKGATRESFAVRVEVLPASTDPSGNMCMHALKSCDELGYTVFVFHVLAQCVLADSELVGMLDNQKKWLKESTYNVALSIMDILCTAAMCTDAHPRLTAITDYDSVMSIDIIFNNFTVAVCGSSALEDSHFFAQITWCLSNSGKLCIKAFELFIRITPQDIQYVQAVQDNSENSGSPHACTIMCDHPITILGVPINTFEVCTPYFYNNMLIGNRFITAHVRDCEKREACGLCLDAIDKWGIVNTFHVPESESMRIIEVLCKRFAKCDRENAGKLAMSIIHECIIETVKGFNIFK